MQLAEDHPAPVLLPSNYQPPALRNMPEVENGFATLLRRHRRVVILLFILFMVGACLYTRLAPKSYKVQTVLEIRGLNQDFMNNRDVSPTGSGIVDQTYIETQVRLLQNEAVTARVVKAMSGNADSHLPTASVASESVVRKILGSMKVKEEGASNLVSIALVGPDPQIAADTANQLARQYIEEEQGARLGEANETDTFLQEQLNEAKTKLQNAEDALQTYAHNSGIVLTNDSQDSVATEHLRQVQQGLSQAEVDLAARNAQLEVARRSSGDSLPEVVNDPVIREDQSKLRDLRVQLADLSTTMTPENYKVQKIQAQIQDLEKEMALHRSIIVERLTMEQHEASRRTALLEDDYHQQLAAAMDQGSKQVRYNMLRNEVDVNRQIYQTMVQKVKEAGVMAAFRTPNARVVSAAIPPTSPSSPNLVVSLALAFLLATVASVLFVLLSERGNRSLRVPGETEVFLPNAELAAIPRARVSRRLTSGSLALSKSKEQRHHPMLQHWTSNDGAILSEAFRMAGTSVLLRTDGSTHSRVLLITSPHPQCGKTMSSANLAISLAEASRRVLVVDGDLRKSGLSQLFGYENSPGLSEALTESGEEDPLNLIRSTDFRGVWVLPSGTVKENAAKLLQSDRLRYVIETLRANFDFVLLDAPPLLELADARLLGKRAGGVILVCRAGRTQRDELNDAWSVLREDGANILGTILNGYDLKTECPSRYSTYVGYTGTHS
jgi:capsular exopolysaccharide synthesis family protein